MSFGIVPQNRTRYAIKTLVVAAHNDFIERRLARLDPLYDFFIGELIGIKRFESGADFHIALSLMIDRGRSKRLQIPAWRPLCQWT